MSDATVYLVPYLDGDWLGYGPLDASIGYGLLPPNRQEIVTNLKTAVGFWKERTGGKVVFGAHTGTYNRETFYCEPAFEQYRALIANGAEIAVHPHEERVRSSHAIDDVHHMDFIITWATNQLKDAGITPSALRIPYNGYVSELTRIAEKNGLLADMSSAPEFEKKLWCSDWRGAPATAFFLDYEDHRNGKPSGANRSPVLEIPLGWDGVEPRSKNYLYNEGVELEQLIAIWDAIHERAKREGPQTIYILSHLHAMAKPDLSDRLTQFLDHAFKNRGMPVSINEAYAMHKRGLQSAA